MRLDVATWNLVLSTLCDPRCKVMEVSQRKSITVIVTSKKILRSIELIYDLTPTRHTKRGTNKQGWRYKVNDLFIKSCLRATVTILLHENGFEKLNMLAVALIDGRYRKLLEHIVTKFSLKTTYSSISRNEDKIIFSRLLLWVDESEKANSVTIIPGLEYKYSPEERITSLALSYNCQLLWNWIFDIKITEPKELLNNVVFKSIENMIKPETFGVKNSDVT